MQLRFDPDGEIIGEAAMSEAHFDLADNNYAVLKAIIRKCSKREKDIYYPREHPTYDENGTPYCPFCKINLLR